MKTRDNTVPNSPVKSLPDTIRPGQTVVLIDPDHDVRRLDDGVNVLAGRESQAVRGFFGYHGNNLGPSLQFDNDFRVYHTGFDLLHDSFKHVAGTDSHRGPPASYIIRGE
jgi:hypothetical protein